MSIWEKLGFGSYKGFSREAEQLLRQAVELLTVTNRSRA